GESGRRIFTGIEITVPVSYAALPARKITAAFQTVLFAVQNIRVGNGMQGKINRAARRDGPKTLRRHKSGHGEKSGQFLLTIKRVPLSFAWRIVIRTFHDIEHHNLFT